MSRKPDQDDVETHIIGKLPWLPPVPRERDLPIDGVEDGTLCFVEELDVVYEFASGRWQVSNPS